MEDQKLENLLNLALETTQEERKRSLNLNVGYEEEGERWDLLIRFMGEPRTLAEAFPEIRITPLLGNYAVVTLPQSRIEEFSRLSQVIYVEKPKRLFFAVDQGRAVSCISPVWQPPFSLSGRGILVACIDSGVDYAHPDFRKEDGTTRILALWDQTIQGKPPEGYLIGAEYGETQINQALQAGEKEEREQLVPSRDLSGHGTAVLGIAAGNGRASGGRYRGVAYESSLLVVKLGNSRQGGFPRTTELIQAVDYAVKKSMELSMPLALNLSFGNSYGSHRGDSLLETYLDQAAQTGRSVICVGAGNEGSQGGHTSGQLEQGEAQEISLEVGAYEPTFNLQIWKAYEDEVEILLIHPDGTVLGPVQSYQGTQRFRVGQTEILAYYGEPVPYSAAQEIYLDFLPISDYVDSGTWKIRLVPGKIVRGEFQMWLPGGGVLNQDTRFSRPNPEATFTIPSTSTQAVTVGAYDGRLQSYAAFSGRGYRQDGPDWKPDLAAPGVGITAPSPGGGYQSYTGTSFAVPFVTGSAALMMEWGIVRGNDPYLYGEKVKAYLRKGARPLPGVREYPNNQVGYGALCLKESLPD